MNEEMKLHLSHFKKYLWDEKNVMVIFGELENILISKQLYEENYGINDGAKGEKTEQLLLSCGLAAASLSDKESFGWTLSLDGDSEGYFVGVEPEGMICIRQKAADEQMKKVYLQRQKGEGPLMQSHFEPTSKSPSKAIEQYFNEVVQTQTRIICLDDNTGVLVQALPDSKMGTLIPMTSEELVAQVKTLKADEKLKPLNEYLVFYECRCDEKMIYEMIDGLAKNQKESIFESKTSVDIECPRCGRKYVVKNDLIN